MRQVVLQMGVTLDGYVAGPGGEGDWGLPAEHPDVRAWKVAPLARWAPTSWAASPTSALTPAQPHPARPSADHERADFSRERCGHFGQNTRQAVRLG